MVGRLSIKALMRRLLNASRAAADAGEFEVAYHALMAALHAAERVDEQTDKPDALAEVERVAKKQAIRVEEIRPSHQLSRAAAKKRGNVSVYDTLQMHTKSARMRIEADARRGRVDFRRRKIEIA